MLGKSVLLINLPNPPGMVANREGVGGLGNNYPGARGFLYPPHTLAAVAGQLRWWGHYVKVIDGAAKVSDLAPIVSEIRAMRPDVVGIHLSYAALNWDMASTNFVTYGLAKTKTVVFGPIVRFETELIEAQTTADAILVGEPEFLFPQVMTLLWERPKHQTGAIYAGTDELPGQVDSEGFADDLDSLAPPAWDLCDIRDGRASIQASRGCDGGCAYCPYVAAQGHRFRSRALESIAEELDWTVRRQGARRVIFRDPAFAARRQRVVDLCELILRRGLRFVWECESRPEHFDPGLLGLMRRAGCEEVKVGLETVDHDLLANLGRINGRAEAPAYLEHLRQLVEASRALDLRLRLFAMYGLPGQSPESVAESKAFVERLRPRAFNAKAFDWYPGLRISPVRPGPAKGGEELVRLSDQIEGRTAPASSSIRRRNVPRWLRRLARPLRLQCQTSQ